MPRLRPSDCRSWSAVNHNNSINTAATSQTVNLSTQVSQFLGVDWVATKSNHDAVTEHQNTEFIQNDLRRWYLTVGGEQIENGKGILANCPSEICALMGIDGGYLAKLQNVPQITPENFTGDAPHSGTSVTRGSTCPNYNFPSPGVAGSRPEVANGAFGARRSRAAASPAPRNKRPRHDQGALHSTPFNSVGPCPAVEPRSSSRSVKLS